ncbi:hypothetical protein ACLIYM_24400 [Streptomyces fenghuangensis]|uniref:hypothetical protein n=1 Tax=Streptomyces sp. ICN903 TaxID=2964654 RepID=UPI001EDB20F4|nr:hypothetical protein [Streptomyces sp. ICN903]MCG3040906.1 hypothetical protein [Streptomyces sp. ICN903]
MHPPHPEIRLRLALDRAAALRREADDQRLARSARRTAPPPRRAGTVRRRVGWALVEAGLRLALSGRGATAAP